MIPVRRSARPWCLAGHANLCIHKRIGNAEVSSLKYGMREFKAGEYWRQLVDLDGQQFEKWEDYVHLRAVRAGDVCKEAEAVINARNGTLVSDALAERNQRIDAEDRKRQRLSGRPSTQETLYRQKNPIQDFEQAPTGTRSDAMLRRLRESTARLARSCLGGGDDGLPSVG